MTDDLHIDHIVIVQGKQCQVIGLLDCLEVLGKSVKRDYHTLDPVPRFDLPSSQISVIDESVRNQGQFTPHRHPVQYGISKEAQGIAAVRIGGFLWIRKNRMLGDLSFDHAHPFDFLPINP